MTCSSGPLPEIACTTRSVDATRELGGAVATLVADGDLVALSGGLGSGKTSFVQGFAAALGVEAPVTSPTFTLANRYSGQFVVNHVDVYRFDSMDEVVDIDLPELLESGVTLIEWADTIEPVLPADRLAVDLALGENDDDREIRLCPRGPSWLARRARLGAAVSPWVTVAAGGEEPAC